MADVDFGKRPEMTGPVQTWLGRIAAQRKAEKRFLKEGREITKIYEDGKAGVDQGATTEQCVPFNILYSNTETLAPALYNNLPRPVVQRRFKDDDPVGKAASDVVKRVLEYLLDSNDHEYSDFDSMMRSTVLEALLPGRGLSRYKYDAKVEKDADGNPTEISYETVCVEEVSWNNVVFGYAKRWVQVPWVAFEHFMTAEEVKETFGEDLSQTELAVFPYPVTAGTEDSASEREPDDPQKMHKDSTGVQLAHVWEIWDKATKKQIFIAEGWGQVIRETPDPLKLSGFFPIPQPLAFLRKISCLTPTPLYKMYQEQAEELNIVTVRITKITKALKVRGFYDQTIGEIAELLKQEDNTLLPATNVAALVQGQSLDRAIWLMPIQDLVGVLQQLVQQRNQIKQVIYEITGISDILRGSSVASETATAQDIKNQWGTLRLKKAQKEVQRYVRDSLRIMAEIAVTKLQPTTLQQMTGLQYPSAAEKQQMTVAMQQMQAAGQQPPPGLQEAMAAPTWEDILGLLANDLQRNYRIDIETNSTVDADATEDKQDVAEVMNAIAQFMNGVQPMLESGYMSFDVAKSLLLATIRRFRFGTDIEDQIKQMQAPPPKQEGAAEAAKAEQEKAAHEADMQMKQLDFQAKQRQEEQSAALEAERMAAEREQMQMEMALKREEHAMRMKELQMQMELATAKHTQSMQATILKAETAEVAAKSKEGEQNASV